jgi:hypothetical protein
VVTKWLRGVQAKVKALTGEVHATVVWGAAKFSASGKGSVAVPTVGTLESCST